MGGTDLKLSPASQNLRSRHVVKDGINYYILFNEENSETSVKISTPVKGNWVLFNPYTLETSKVDRDQTVKFNPWELKVLIIRSK
jgi:predicted metalloenzyme YecM